MKLIVKMLVIITILISKFTSNLINIYSTLIGNVLLFCLIEFKNLNADINTT